MAIGRGRCIGIGVVLAATACGGSSAPPRSAPVAGTATTSPSATGDAVAGGYGGPPVAASPSAARASLAPRSPAAAAAPRASAAAATKASSPSPSPKAASPQPSPKPSPQPSPKPSPKPSPRPSPSPAAAATTYEIQMRGLTFAPSSLTIAVGDSVRVRNADTGHHTFTDAPLFDSGDLGPGQTFTYRFRTAGRYDFVCSYHSGAGMTGTVTVR